MSSNVHWPQPSQDHFILGAQHLRIWLPAYQHFRIVERYAQIRTGVTRMLTALHRLKPLIQDNAERLLLASLEIPEIFEEIPATYGLDGELQIDAEPIRQDVHDRSVPAECFCELLWFTASKRIAPTCCCKTQTFSKKCYYVAKATDFGGSCASKLQAHRQKHLKKLKASSSFVCVVEEHGLKWVIRNSEERCAPVIGVGSGPEFVELDRTRCDGPFPANADLASEPHFTDIGANDDNSASQASRQCSKTNIDLPPDGTRDGYSIPEPYTTKDESQPALDEDDNIMVNQKVQQQPDAFECAGDASMPAVSADAARDR
ncbi:uncharacterized protein Z519_00404 [Cladophialophora bantiana CBS 173.52]|uniref:Uncharacterized protein n=1 Tax=Cladophialophora bantiana (strain ATCC 10958 / CBS 173.52 / CDC B-1940 / NIH 8579) TaxID=1442370 RepID=A0A0D2F9H7_CLAB1|nr:uncharacterized protein Z519_00404 [Cladophialophora bantiana CBS 173.52]KIW98741.1 hypothetical protein Z519_00404 [Cladophialophora bantiana CBS 173.52]